MESHPLPKHIVRIKKLRSLLAIIENSIKGGDNYYFRNLFADENGKEIDILENGQNSCGVFVSWTLLTLELIKRPHATVYATEKDMIASGWYLIEDLRPGAVIIWEKKDGATGLLGEEKVDFYHIGFYVGEDQAISNSSKDLGFPRKHHITSGVGPDGGAARKVEKIYWHPDLDQG